MRIIAGEFKGRTLKTPKWEGLRPTSDKLRETLFNIVAPRIAGAHVLDAFAGTGAVGLESVSRGAALAVFIERDRRAALLIEGNVLACGAQNRCVIIRDTVERALAGVVRGSPFDLIVLDPPYDCPTLDEIVSAAGRHLAPGGVIVLEHAKRRAAPAAVGVRAVRLVPSGDSALTLYEV